jgi:hypothetical protein
MVIPEMDVYATSRLTVAGADRRQLLDRIRRMIDAGILSSGIEILLRDSENRPQDSLVTV